MGLLNDILGAIQLSLLTSKQHLFARGIDGMPVCPEEVFESWVKTCHQVPSVLSMVAAGIESTCDESGIALIEDDRIICSKIASQWDLVQEYGGVVPALAARQHELSLPLLFSSMLKQLNIRRNRDLNLNTVAVATGPGLGPCLHAGLEFGKGICEAYSVPLVAVNHLEAHLMVNHHLNHDLKFPYLGLILSGGHTLAVIARGLGQYELVGSTMDDAIGEAYDKVARLLNIQPDSGMSAGAALEKAASFALNPDRFHFPVAMSRRQDCNFSFSGLKSAVRRQIESATKPLTKETAADIAAVFQRSVISQLQSRLRRALKARRHHGLTSIVLGGGVACNESIQQCIRNIADEHDLQFICPPAQFCGDNGFSIAYTGRLKYELGHMDALTIGYSPRWPLCQNQRQPPSAELAPNI